MQSLIHLFFPFTLYHISVFYWLNINFTLNLKYCISTNPLKWSVYIYIYIYCWKYLPNFLFEQDFSIIYVTEWITSHLIQYDLNFVCFFKTSYTEKTKTKLLFYTLTVILQYFNSLQICFNQNRSVNHV